MVRSAKVGITIRDAIEGGALEFDAFSSKISIDMSLMIA